MEQYIMPRNAYRKLRAAKSLVQTLYIYGATGFGKTAFVQKTLEKRRPATGGRPLPLPVTAITA